MSTRRKYLFQLYMGAGKSKIPSVLLKELANDTHFEEKELRSWYRVFSKLCPDGMLNKYQFIGVYEGLYDNNNVNEYAEHVFRTFDTNSNNKIDFREFMRSMSVITRGSTEEKLKWAFNIYDIDGTGYISQSEMLHIIRSVQKMVGADHDERLSKDNVLKVFNEMNKSKNGILSIDEFIKGAMEDQTFVHMLQAYTRL